MKFVSVIFVAFVLIMFERIMSKLLLQFQSVFNGANAVKLRSESLLNNKFTLTEALVVNRLVPDLTTSNLARPGSGFGENCRFSAKLGKVCGKAMNFVIFMRRIHHVTAQLH